MSIEQIRITEQISYIKASDNPLSADVILVEGCEYLYVFDVGTNEQVAEYLNSIPKKKRVILSHFHTDHMGNIGRFFWENVFFGANTEKYFQHYISDYLTQRFAELPSALTGALSEEAVAENKFSRYVTVFGPIKISDGIELEIVPVPSSHAKGSLLLQVNGEYIFVGDGSYPQEKDGKAVYNVQLLKEQIKLLKELPGEKLFLSHEKRPVKAKKGMVRFLEGIYEKREKNSPYIEV